MLSTTYQKVIVLSYQMANRFSVTSKQKELLNKTAFGKAILARWYCLRKKYRLAAEKFLSAYDDSNQEGFLFEAAYASLMMYREFGKSSDDSFSYKTKRTLNRFKKQAIDLLFKAAEGGHDQASACLLYMYMMGDQVQINRKIFFQGLKAASYGFVDERSIPQRSLLFSLMPAQDEIRMLDQEYVMEVWGVIAALAYDHAIKLTDSESELLSDAFDGNPFLVDGRIDPIKSQKIMTKVGNIFWRA